MYFQGTLPLTIMKQVFLDGALAAATMVFLAPFREYAVTNNFCQKKLSAFLALAVQVGFPITCLPMVFTVYMAAHSPLLAA